MDTSQDKGGTGEHLGIWDLGSIWEASERHLWASLGISGHLGSGEASGKHQGSIWEHLGVIWEYQNIWMHGPGCLTHEAPRPQPSPSATPNPGPGPTPQPLTHAPNTCPKWPSNFSVQFFIAVLPRKTNHFEEKSTEIRNWIGFWIGFLIFFCFFFGFFFYIFFLEFLFLIFYFNVLYFIYYIFLDFFFGCLFVLNV